MNVRRIVAGLLLALATLPPAHADVSGTLQYRDPVGVARPDESIDVWVTLRLNDDSDPLTFVANSPAPFGLPQSSLPTLGSGFANGGYQYDIPFASYTSARTIIGGLFCSNEFTYACDSTGPYRAVFVDPTRPEMWSERAGVTMAPGESRDFVFLTWVPNGGSVAPGTYSDTSPASFVFQIVGTDADQNMISEISSIYFGMNETFTRTVTAVPEPTAYALFLFGLGVLAYARKRGSLG